MLLVQEHPQATLVRQDHHGPPVRDLVAVRAAPHVHVVNMVVNMDVLKYTWAAGARRCRCLPGSKHGMPCLLPGAKGGPRRGGQHMCNQADLDDGRS